MAFFDFITKPIQNLGDAYVDVFTNPGKANFGDYAKVVGTLAAAGTGAMYATNTGLFAPSAADLQLE